MASDFTGPVNIDGAPILPGVGAQVFTGNAFFVDSSVGQDIGPHGSKSSPLATLDYAIGRCTADKGDVIFVMPNHAETITGAGGITADVAGVTIIGLGSGNQRPRFLMDGGTSVTFVVSAADVTIRNLVFAGGHASIVTCFNITGKYCWIDQCEFVQNTTSENFLTPIKATSTSDGNADGLKVTNCYMYQVDAGTLEFIEINADVTGLVVTGNVAISEGTASPLILCATGKDLKGCFVTSNFLSHKMTAGSLFISNDTASPNNSGIIAHNRFGHADVTTTHTIGAVGGCRFFDNLSVSTDALSGFVLPAIDVDS